MRHAVGMTASGHPRPREITVPGLWVLRYPPGWCIIGVLPLIVPGVIVSEGFNKLTTLDTDDQHVREEGRRGNSEREIGFKGANGFEPVPGCPVQSSPSLPMTTSRLVSSVAKELQQKTREA